MLKYFITVLFLCLSCLLLAQSKVADLLWQADSIYSSDPDSSYALCLEAEKLNGGDQKFLGGINLSKGRYHLLITDYEAAGKEFAIAQEVFTKQNDLDNLAHLFSLKSILFDRIGDHNAAMSLLKKSYNIHLQSGNKHGQVSALLNLTGDYLEHKMVDSTFHYLQELERLSDHLTDGNHYYYFQNWGRYYHASADYPKAIEFFEKALGVANELDMLDSKATITMFMSRTYRFDAELDKAEEMARLSYQISKDGDLIYETSEALVELLKTLEAKKDIEGAYETLAELRLVEKEIYDLEKVSKVKEVEGKLQIAEKENVIAQQNLTLEKEKSDRLAMESRNQKLWLFLVLGIVLLTFTLFIYFRTRKLNATIKVQKDEVEEKSLILEEAYNNIRDSLEYSKYLQNTMLPSSEYLKGCFDDHFVFFSPKDLVSGDFYWVRKKGDVVDVCVADCTGHGVPGAMVSVIGHNGLNRSIKELEIQQPSKVLDNLTEYVEETLYNEEKGMKDGMDICYCKFDQGSNTIQFSGANNPLYVISDGALTIYPPDKQPIGIFESREQFTQKEIQVKKGDCLYLFSDGYADQFGGPKGKKFKYKQFQELLISIAKLPMANQREALSEAFHTWKGDLEQLDDVCILGIRV